MERVVKALGGSLPVGNKFFTANVRGNQHTVTVFCSTSPNMERVLYSVTGANNTATVTCTEIPGQWEVTVMWVEPDTSKDEAIARAPQKENACGCGGAGRGAGGRGGGSAMWTKEQYKKYEQQEADYRLALQLANDEGRGGANGRGGGRAFCGGRGVGMGINPANVMSDSDFECWLAAGGGASRDDGGVADFIKSRAAAVATTEEEQKALEELRREL